MALFGHEAQLHYHNLEPGKSFQNPRQLPLQSHEIKEKVRPRISYRIWKKIRMLHTVYVLQAYKGARDDSVLCNSVFMVSFWFENLAAVPHDGLNLFYSRAPSTRCCCSCCCQPGDVNDKTQFTS